MNQNFCLTQLELNHSAILFPLRYVRITVGSIPLVLWLPCELRSCHHSLWLFLSDCTVRWKSCTKPWPLVAKLISDLSHPSGLTWSILTEWSGDKSSSAPFGVVWQERWGTGQSGELALIYGCYLLSVVNNQPGDSTWLLLAFHIWIKSYSKLTARAVCLVQLGVCVNRPLGVAQKPLSIGGQPL